MRKEVIGSLIKKERDRMNLTQNELAHKAGFKDYQKLLYIEKGKREIKLSELDKIAKALGLNVSYFLDQRKMGESKILWRECLDSKECKRIENILHSYCNNFMHLNQLLEKEYKKFIPMKANEFEREKFNDDFEFAEGLAEQYEDEWNLGEYPAKNLFHVLKNKNILVFALNLKDIGSSASLVGEFGAAILLNKNNAPWRINFDIAHELFHIIVWNLYDHSEIYYDERGKSDIEQYTDYFAANLLIPKRSIKNEIEGVEVGGKVLAEDIVDIACKFNVSLDALTYRFQSLKAFNEEDMEELRKDDTLKRLFWDRMKKQIDNREELKELPEKYVEIAYISYIKEKISKMKLAEYIGKKVGEIDYFLKNEYDLSSDKEIEIENSLA